MMQLTSFLTCQPPHALSNQKIRETKAEERQRAGVKKITSSQAVTKFDGLIGIQTEHSWPAPLDREKLV